MFIVLSNHLFHFFMSLTNSEQKIFIWIDFSSETEVAILHGVQVALILDKEICLIYHASDDGLKIEEAESRLIGLTFPLMQTFGSARIHTFVTIHPLDTILTELAEEFDALLLVAPKTKSKELLPKLPHSGFPFYLYQIKSIPKNVIKRLLSRLGT